MSDVYSGHGERPEGANEVVSEKILTGTIFYRPADAVKKESFFQNTTSGLAKNWQSVMLPLKGNYRYDVDAICLTHSVQLENGANATMTAQLMKIFEETTLVKVDHVKLKSMYEFTLADLLPYSWQPEVAADGSFTWKRVERQTKWLPLREVLQIGRDLDIDIYIEPPSGANTFTMEAYAAGTTPMLIGSGLPAISGGAAAERGHNISIHLHSTEGAKS